MYKFFSFLFILLFLGCKIEKQEIHYNIDNCAFCHMTITDKRFGTESITDKGKVYKFDSIECQIDFQKEGDKSLKYHFITDYLNPGILIPAEESWVLKSKEIVSPMGRNLSGFQAEESAKLLSAEKKGEYLPYSIALKSF